jgi:hypothetical protein
MPTTFANLQRHLQVLHPDGSARDEEPHLHLSRQVPTELRLKNRAYATERYTSSTSNLVVR